MNRRTGVKALAIASALWLGQPATAQTFPTGPVRLTAPFPAGSGPDAVMRLLAEKLGEVWKQPVVIDNKPGASGFIALDAVKRAPATGRELLVADVGNLSVNPSLYKRLPYDPERDFAPVGLLYRATFFLTVGSASRFRTVGDLIAAAAAGANKVSYGSNAVGGPLHLGAAGFEYATRTQMVHVPFKETSALYASVATGEVDFAFGTLGTAGPLLDAGRLRFLAVADRQRSPVLPQVPTLEEAGGPKNVEVSTWIALLAPAGTPELVVAALNKAVAAVLARPDVAKRLTAMGFTAATSTPRELAELIHSDRLRYAEIVKRTGASAE